MIKEEIQKILQKALKGGLEGVSVEETDNKDFGDYFTNAALVLAKKSGKNPREVADDLVKNIKSDIFEKVEIAGPGFINFFVKDKIYTDYLKKIDKNIGKVNVLKNKKIILDYTDPNPFKEFHIGHLMSNAIGESLSRIFEFEGARVKRVCYSGDVGIHVAKAMWGILKNKDSFPKDSDSLSLKMKFLSSAYASGAEAYEKDENAKKEIVSLNKKIFEKSDKEVNRYYDKGKKWSLEHFNELYIKLDTKFDYFIFESEVFGLGKRIVETGLDKGIFEKSEGAVVFKGEKCGLHTRVFINSEGLPTYEAKDLALAEIKYKKYKYDQSFVITGNEVNDYFRVMLCAMKETNEKLAKMTNHIGHGMLRLPEGKMSSRTGKVITGESLIEKVEELVREKIKGRELSEKEKSEIIQSVAIGAVRYSVLRQSIGSDIIYDFDKSISFEGDSGPYLQYAYTRAVSVLNKAKEEGIKPSFKKVPDKVAELEKAMYGFEDAVLRAGSNYEPHHIVLYLTGLAGMFNSYYAKNKIVDKNDEMSSYKVALTQVFALIVKNGLWLLGIKTLNKM